MGKGSDPKKFPQQRLMRGKKFSEEAHLTGKNGKTGKGNEGSSDGKGGGRGSRIQIKEGIFWGKTFCNKSRAL